MLVHELEVGGDAGAVPSGRHFTSSALAGVLDEEVVDAAELVMTELLTNALLHGAAPIRLTIRVAEDAGCARLEVYDASRALPLRSHATPDGMTGRGLALVDALSRAWGVEPDAPGKRVWAELTPESVVVAEVGEIDLDALLAGFDDEQDGGVRHTVILGDVPTYLLLSGEAHVDSVVRELTLASTGAESGMTGAVPAALAALVHEVVTQFGEARHAIRRQALAAAAEGRDRTTLRLTLPAEAADAGERYLAALEEADAYGRASRLLTLAAPPQEAAFRRWYVSSLVDGLRRASAGEATVVAPSFESFLLEEVHHLAELQEVSQRAARLQGVTASLAVVLEREQVMRIALDEAVAATGADTGAFVLVTPDGVRAGATVGYTPADSAALVDAWDVMPTAARTAYDTGRPVWVESRAEFEQRFPEFSRRDPKLRAVCAVPLNVAGHLVGIMRLSFDEDRLFSDDERAFVSATGAVAAQALERANLYEARGRAARVLAGLAGVALSFASASTVEDLTRVVIDQGLAVLGADGGAVCVRDDERGVIRLAASDSLGPRVQEEFAELPLDGPLPGSYTARTGETVLLPTERSGLDFTPAMQIVYEGTGRRAWASLPLVAGGRLLGSLVVSWTDERPFTEQDQELFAAFAAQCAQALDRIQTLEAERRAAAATRRLSETLQRSLLTRPPEPDHLEVAVRYAPASQEAQVGGDWYDAFFTRDGALSVVIGDCTGHDREAVAAMAAVRNLLRATAYAVGDTPAAVLTAHEETMAGLDVTALATAMLARIEQDDAQRAQGMRSLTWSSAGHLPPLLRRADGTTIVLRSTPDLMLGLMPSTDRADHRVDIEPGTTLLLYTDGLIERRGEDLDVGIERLRSTLTEIGGLPLDDVCDVLLNRLGADAEDDVALLAVRFHDENRPRPAEAGPRHVPHSRPLER